MRRLLLAPVLVATLLADTIKIQSCAVTAVLALAGYALVAAAAGVGVGAVL